MNTDGLKVWQIAAGDTDRAYPGVMLRWDVMVMGPGECGPWPGCVPLLLKDGWTKKKLAVLRRYYEDVNRGDLVVLRVGTSEVYGLGEVADDHPIWLDDFGDIDGWDLQHVRRVRWLWRSAADEPKQFPANTLKWGETLQVVDAPVVLDWIKNLEVPKKQRQRDLVSLPANCQDRQPLTLENPERIGEYLFDAGVSANSIDALMTQVNDLIRIAKWYARNEEQPSEHETVAYLVVPLLRALGWTPQRMAVEWKNVDIALFRQLPRGDATLAVSVEAKRRNNSCLRARSQAERYAEAEGRDGCMRLIVTDGLRYGVYVRTPGGDFPDNPEAYLNLTRLAESYPAMACAGAKEALSIMAADWNPILAVAGQPEGAV